MLRKVSGHVCAAARRVGRSLKLFFFIVTLSLLEGIRMTLLGLAYTSAVWNVEQSYVRRGWRNVCGVARRVGRSLKLCFLIVIIACFTVMLSLMEGIRMTLLSMAYMSAAWTAWEVSKICGPTRHIIAIRSRQRV